MVARGLGATFVAVCVGALLSVGPAAAQDEDTGVIPPPRLSHVDGASTVVRDGVAEHAFVNAPLIEGDRLDVQSGRVAIQWPDGLVLAADAFSIVELTADRTVRLERGQVIVLSPETLDSRPLLVRTVNATVAIDRPGQYRIQMRDGDVGGAESTILDVDAGDTVLEAAGRRVSVASAQQVAVRGPLAPAFESTGSAADGFIAWAQAAAQDALDGSAVSASYLPPDLVVYGATLDRNGTWAYDADAGYVWYPRVATEWRPYSTGVWVQAGRYGWTWAGSDAWAWPTHHYGTWAFGSQGRWYWSPSRSWSPARVRWAIGPGYVAWCPLDQRGRPVMDSPFTPRHDGRGERGPAVDPWRGWTTLTSKDFRSRVAVQRAAVDGRRLSPADLQAFVTQPVPPTRTRGGFTAAQRTTDMLPPQPPASTPAGEPSPPAQPAWGSAYPQPWYPSRPNPTDHPVYVPTWPAYGAYSASGNRVQSAPEPVPYNRPTPFINPRWTNRPGMPYTAGLPQIQDPPAAPNPPAATDPRDHGASRHGDGGQRNGDRGGRAHGGSSRVPPPATPGRPRP